MSDRSGTLDDLVRSAARRAPDRIALRAGPTVITFAELDDRVSACAAGLAARLGGGGLRIGVVSSLDPDYAIAFHAVIRSGNVVVPINPRLNDSTLAHVLTVAEVRLVVAAGPGAGPVVALRSRLPSAPEVLDVDAIIRGGREQPTPTADPGEVACVQFTSGTTGLPKGVLLSHRNLLANAVQTSEAHRLDGTAVALNHLPGYHLMHLNSALHAGATQVLCPGPDPAEAIRLANQHGATRFYSLPVRLAQLAADPALPGYAFSTVRAVLSGGSRLPVDAAEKLSRHFGIPVLQGYGLAETSPLTHSDSLDHPATGSVGPPVRDTECRTVDLTTGEPATLGRPGEVQVRGPQVMLGYLDPAQPTNIDADGWLSTGDVGRIDESGRLFLIDRIKDVFKCDNELVSPAAVEQVLARHPDVVDCAVVDRPDRFHGAVAHAFVTLAHPSARHRLPDVLAFVNAHLAPHETVHDIDVLDVIPRSANGKTERRLLRESLSLDADFR